MPPVYTETEMFQPALIAIAWLVLVGVDAAIAQTTGSHPPNHYNHNGRVGMWRGGGRPGMSVAAPFVWRCLSGSTVAPFPHPSHRTGHADLSGSSAIAGFRPHGSHRAALPQWALQDGPEAGRSPIPGLMDCRFWEWEDGQDFLERRPGHVTLLASCTECLSPEPEDAISERTQRSIVEDDPVVLAVTAQYLAKPPVLLPDRGVHPVRHLLTERLQLTNHALGLRLPFDREPATSGLAAIVREAQKVEGLRASQPGGLPVPCGEPPELDEPGLALVERQAELRQPVLERHKKRLPIPFSLTADHQIVRISTDDNLPGRPMSPPLVYPEVNDIVEEDVGEDRADARPLRRANLHRLPSAALQDAGLEPPLDQAVNPWVGYPMPQHPNQPSVVNGIKEGSDVEIEHPAHTLRHQGLFQSR